MRLKRILRQGGLFHMVRLRVSWPTLASAQQPLGVASRRQLVSLGCIQLCFWRSCNPRLIFYHFQPSHVVANRTHLTLGSVQMANPLFSVSCESLLCKPCTFLHRIPSDIPGMMLEIILTIGHVSNVSLQGGERCTGRKGRRTATDTGWFNETQMHLRFNQFLLDKG